MDRRIFHLREEILDSLQRDLTIEEMAETVKLSVPHLQKLFKSQIGISPKAFVREKRLEKARELLESDEFLRISEISRQVGMPNDSRFTRDFKKKFGVTPTEYRKNYWDKIQAERGFGQK